MRVFRAKSMATTMSNIEREVALVNNKLQHLLGQLYTALKVEEVKEDVRIVVQAHSSSSVEVFPPAFNAPALLPQVCLDFALENAEGRF